MVSEEYDFLMVCICFMCGDPEKVNELVLLVSSSHSVKHPIIISGLCFIGSEDLFMLCFMKYFTLYFPKVGVNVGHGDVSEASLT